MYKYLLSFMTTVLVYSLATVSFSQTVMFQSQQTKTNNKPPAFSMDQYKQDVQALDKKTQQNSKQRIDKLANPVPPFPPIPGATLGNTPLTAPTSLPRTERSATPPATLEAAPAMEQTAPPPAGSMNAAPRAQPYTGFQGAGTNTPKTKPSFNSTNPANSGASSEWGNSIQY